MNAKTGQNQYTALKEYCRDEFARIAGLLNQPLTTSQADALESKLARIRAMFVAVDETQIGRDAKLS